MNVSRLIHCTVYLYLISSFADPYALFAIDNVTADVRNIKPLIVDVPTLTVVVLVSETCTAVVDVVVVSLTVRTCSSLVTCLVHI